jgi:hypothetical protein
VGQQEVGVELADEADEFLPALERGPKLAIGRVQHLRLDTEGVGGRGGLLASTGRNLGPTEFVVAGAAVGERDEPNRVPPLRVAGGDPSGLDLRVVRVGTQDEHARVGHIPTPDRRR